MVKLESLQQTETLKEEWVHRVHLHILPHLLLLHASAIAGKIDYDWNNGGEKIKAEIKINKKTSSKKSSVKILPEFPSVIEGNLLFCHQDNLEHRRNLSRQVYLYG